MKVFVQGEDYGWIIDEIVNDYKRFTRHTVCTIPDIAWSASIYHLPNIAHFNCPKVVTVHHIDPLKLSKYDHVFNEIKLYADVVICPNDLTLTYAKEYINKPVYKLPYWIIDKRRLPTNTDKVEKLRKEVQTDKEIVIGYFQKDSKGNSTIPKLSKGPDIFLQVVTELNKKYNIKILLAGFNRNYLIENFKRQNIKYSFYHMYPNVNDLYDICDWYFVTSRTEGGPQAVLEAPYRGVKILLTRVGIAPEVLPEEYLCDTPQDFIAKFELPNLVESIKQNIVNNYTPEILIPKYDKILEDIWKH